MDGYDGYQDGNDWIKHCFQCNRYYKYVSGHWDELYSMACKDCVEATEKVRRNQAAAERQARIKYIQDGYECLIPPQTH